LLSLCSSAPRHGIEWVATHRLLLLFLLSWITNKQVAAVVLCDLAPFSTAPVEKVQAAMARWRVDERGGVPHDLSTAQSHHTKRCAENFK